MNGSRACEPFVVAWLALSITLRSPAVAVCLAEAADLFRQDDRDPVAALIMRRVRAWEVPPAGDATDPYRLPSGTVQVRAVFVLP
ncbi:MAG: hypothetical protein QG671_2721 [Actinomycetota bacterium]|nr:hypothetical protein [Actinomycetota bacterium]